MVTLTTFNISDIHTNASRIPVADKCDSMDAVLTSNFLAQIDILFIAGDFFDHVMSLNHRELPILMDWIFRLLVRCESASTKIRILEGTPLHDRKQSELFITLANQLKKRPDIKYFKELDIEILDNGVSIFYIPDEYRPYPDLTLKELKTKMSEKSLSVVDIGIMHGFFAYQLPEIVAHAAHDFDEYSKIVKHYISIGHVHDMSKNGKVLAQGSWDADKFGDSQIKGGWLCTLDLEDAENDVFTFITNKLSHRYIDIPLDGLNLVEATEVVCNYMPFTERDHLRLVITDQESENIAIALRSKFPDIDWHSKKKPVVEKQEVKRVVNKTVPINETTIMGVVKTELESRNKTQEQITSCLKELELYVDAVY